MTDPNRLHRFEVAQARGDAYARAVAELRAGRKTSHWMWFVFPQLAGLGHSPMSATYAISSLDDARAYLAHPLLGARLVECAHILTELTARTAQDIFGTTDALKLRSSMTLFLHAATDGEPFRTVLEAYFGGVEDEVTTRLLRAQD